MSMVIKEEKKFSISDIVAGFMEDTSTNQVSSMNGRLDIRPKYQRQFVYGEEDSKAVIDSIINCILCSVLDIYNPFLLYKLLKIQHVNLY